MGHPRCHGPVRDQTRVVSTTPCIPPVADINWAAWLPLILLAVAIAGYGVFDVSRSEVRYLPKWAWALICLLSVPFGTILYLTVGRQEPDRTDRL